MGMGVKTEATAVEIGDGNSCDGNGVGKCDGA